MGLPAVSAVGADAHIRPPTGVFTAPAANAPTVGARIARPPGCDSRRACDRRTEPRRGGLHIRPQMPASYISPAGIAA